MYCSLKSLTKVTYSSMKSKIHSPTYREQKGFKLKSPLSLVLEQYHVLKLNRKAGLYSLSSASQVPLASSYHLCSRDTRELHISGIGKSY